jgi:hypothetical protein
LLYESVTQDGSTEVLANTAFRFQFDRFLLPLSVTRQSICLQPILSDVLTLSDCTQGVFLEPTYDPVLRTATYRQPPTQTPLVAGNIYKLTAFVPLSPGDYGFFSFDGAPLDLPFVVEITVQVENGAPYDMLPSTDHFCASPMPVCASDCTTACLAQCDTGDSCSTCAATCASSCPRSVSSALGGCATSMCHGGAAPAEALELSSAAGILATAVDKTAHLTEGGENATTPDENPPRFGRAMPIIDPAFASNSFLLYKLLASTENTLENPPDPAELERLRSRLAVGLPMPPSNGSASGLRAGEPEWISAWIQQGAPTETCSP